jgi:hypothetical protein|tara:strand:+ start:1150 stop:2295 length:1146 start_codon:yes stop_codon:yes gene_type:complete
MSNDATNISTAERNSLFRKTRHRLGAPVRKVELTDEQLDTLLIIAVEDYVQYQYDWLVDNQWGSLLNQSLTSEQVVAGLSQKTLGVEIEYTYAYSKAVGLQSRGPWELKTDYVDLVANQQQYLLPANREINEVLWFTPPTLDQSVIDPFIGIGGAFGGGFGGEGGLAQFGMGSYYVMPAFDVLLRQTDRNLKNRMIRGDLQYKITAGPTDSSGNNTRYLWLMPTPGGRYDKGAMSLYQGKVWYRYYDIDNASDDTSSEACLNANADVIQLPSDVPLDAIEYSSLNLPSKIWVRRYLLGLAKETLGRVRGKFSGALNVPGADVSMDYESLLSEGKDEQSKLIEELGERLTSISNEGQLNAKSTTGEALNKSLSYIPLGLYVI